MFYRSLGLLLAVCCSLYAYSQEVKGRLLNTKGQALPQLRIETAAGAVWSDSSGYFQLFVPAGAWIKLRDPAWMTDSIQIHQDTSFNWVLFPVQQTGAVKVKGTQDAPFAINVIGQGELRKAACCDLAGCFETQTTVQPQTTNVITNAKELRILGLSGVYNQLLVEGMPLLLGLTYTYGISSYPGPAIKSIFISKGTTSVLQGADAISGQINVMTKDPANQERLYLNGYMNSFGERHLNALVAGKWKKWEHGFTGHVVRPAWEVDGDKDQLLDVPRLTRYMLAERLRYGREGKFGWNLQLQGRYLYEERQGGQLGYNPRKDAGTTNRYGQWIRYHQPEFWAKGGYRFNADLSIQFQGATVFHRQDSWFGLTHYNAWQWLGYGQVMADWYYQPLLNLKGGLAYRHLQNQEMVSLNPGGPARNISGDYRKNEQIAGLFLEHQWQSRNRHWVWLAGGRIDHLNGWGWLVTPRTQLKWTPTTQWTLRGSAGRGWRTVNLFSEHINVLASNRIFLLQERPAPELAWNTGIHVKRAFQHRKWEANLAADVYWTWFDRQFFPDYESLPGAVVIRNFNGRATGRAVQVEGDITWNKVFSVKSGYTFLEVWRSGEGLLPFNPRHKVMSAVSWKFWKDRFQADMNLHWFGSQRLPSTEGLPLAYRQPEWSPSYWLCNVQLTWKYKRWELYGGAENLFDFRQRRPVAGWEDPFGPWFDPSFVWGPTRGREIYLGFRYLIPE